MVPNAVTTGQQHIIRTQFRDEVLGNGRRFFCAEAAHENIRLGMAICLFRADLAFVNQRLHVGVICCSVDQLTALVMVDPGVTGVHPVAGSGWRNQKRCKRAVRFLFGRDRGELDDDMGFVNDLPEHGRCVISLRCVALKKLLRRQHDLVRCLAPAATASHAIGHDAQHAAGNAGVAYQVDLVLLIVPIPFMDSRGCSDSITFGHCVGLTSFVGSIYECNQRIIRRSSAHGKNTLDLNHHSPERPLIEPKIEHAEMNALADSLAHAPLIEELILGRLTSRLLQPGDRISCLDASLTPPEPA